MPFRDQEWENMQRDCSFFPAYTDYLFGLDVRPQVAEEPGLHPLLYIPQFEPIRYTNSMPSRSVLYNSAPDVPYHMAANSARTTGVDSLITPGLNSGQLAVLPHSTPVVHHISIATSPEVVAPVPQNASRATPTTLSADQAASSAEVTRRRLLEASQQQRSPATRPHCLRNGSFAISGSKATHSSLAHSSSLTDVDGEIGLMPTSIMPISRVPPLEHASQSQQSQQQHPGRPTNPTPSWQNPFVSSSGVNIIRPGDLFADPRYLAAFRENLQNMEATIAQNWGILEHHPDEIARKQALTRLQAASVRVSVLMQKWQLDAQVEVQASSRSSPYNSCEMQQAFAHTQDLSESYMGQTMRQQHCPMQYQGPQQSFPPHLDNSVSQGSQQPQHGLPVCNSPTQPMHNHQAMSGAEKTQHGLPESPPSRKHEDEQTLDEPQTPLQVRRWVKDAVDAASQHPHLKAPTGQQSKTPFIKPELVTNAQNSSLPSTKREQMSPAQQSGPQLQPPTLSPQDAQRNHIRALLPKFLGALRVVQTPVDPADLQAAQRQQAARSWMGSFKAGLSPQGHAMLDEIVGNMMKAKSEGRDWMEEIKNM
ncbi:hypothetical protein BKA63DRAFT_549323 [Paraphoma chrysanthemicola]|nr:hypothetical protein BKA63DRAFT_549323 [Paraphoma chrysanthemicola]